MSEQLVSVLQDLLASARKISDNIERIANQLAPTIDSSIQLGLVPDSTNRSEFHYIYVGGMNIDYPAYTLDYKTHPVKPPREKTETNTFVGVFEKFWWTKTKTGEEKLIAQFKADRPTRIRAKLDGHFSIRLLASMLLMNPSQNHCPIEIFWTMGDQTSAVFCSVKIYVNGTWEELRYDNGKLDRIQKNPIGAANKVHQNLGLPPVEELTNDRNTEDEQQNVRSGVRSPEPPPRQSQPKAQPLPDERVRFPQNPSPQPVAQASRRNPEQNKTMLWLISQMIECGYMVDKDEAIVFCQKFHKKEPADLSETEFFDLLKYFCCQYWANIFLRIPRVEAETSFAAVSAAIDQCGKTLEEALADWMDVSMRRGAELAATGEEF